MGRYFFDIRDGRDFSDEKGSEWPDLAAVRIEAARYSAEVLKEMPERFWHAEQWTMSVFDEHRKPVFTLKFSAEMASTPP
jgi:hypothetical protein